jgi:hypothetical protein
MSIAEPVYKLFSRLRYFIADGETELAIDCFSDLQKMDLLPQAEELLIGLARRHPYLYEYGVELIRGRLSHLDTPAQEQPGVGIVSCCMNRNDNLEAALDSWLELDVDEIVIVDWSSEVPVSQSLAHINDDRLKIIRVEGEARWILTYAFNVGLRFCGRSKIFKLDADIVVSGDFLEVNHFETGEFVRGHWQQALDNDQEDQVYTNGSFGAHKKDLREIGYFNEFIRTYGWDDSDLYGRLCTAAGLSQKHIAFGSMRHLEQGEDERLENQEISGRIFPGGFTATQLENEKNKRLCSMFDFWHPSGLQDYEIKPVGNNRYVARRISEDIAIPEYALQDAIDYAVLQLLQVSYSSRVWQIGDQKALARFIYSNYQHGVPAEDLAAILAFENDCSTHFIGDGSIIEAILKLSLDADHCSTGHVIVKRGKGDVVSIRCASQDYRVVYLEQDNYRQAYDFRAEVVRSRGEASAAELVDAGAGLDGKLLLGASVFDESVPHRMAEYLESFSRNLGLFDLIVLFYEEDTGAYLEESERITRNALEKGGPCAKVFYVRTEGRPTFRQLFDFTDRYFRDTIACIANADIAFDETLADGTRDLPEDVFLALSRIETTPASHDPCGRIMNQFGLPNFFSADAWIYRAPLRYSFRCDYPIGSFHCDSYLNHHISESGYKLYNPCLSINCFHIHDPVYNSSNEKEALQKAEIEKSIELETEAAGGSVPVKGVQWCRAADVGRPDMAGRLTIWEWLQVEIQLAPGFTNFPLALIQLIMCLRINAGVDPGKGIWLNIVADDAGSELGDLAFGLMRYLGEESIRVAVRNTIEGRAFGQDVEGYEKTEVSHAGLIDSYSKACALETGLIYDSTQTGFCLGEDGQPGLLQGPSLLCAMTPEASDIDVYCLLCALCEEDIETMRGVLTACVEQGHVMLTPFLHELERLSAGRGDFFAYDRFAGREVCLTGAPDVSFVTSIFRGEEFFRGYLENIAASVMEANAEVILVDANSPGGEHIIFDEFMEQYPGLRERFHYFRLDEDPGLYNCWKLAIQRAASGYVSNANLDDRRSPFQASRLINSLRAKPACAGAASAIRANTARNASWYQCTVSDYWFDHGFEDTVDFSSLYVTGADGLVRSQNIMHCMPVWKKSLHDKYGYFDEKKYGTSADWAFWLACTREGESFLLVPELLSQYYISETSHNRVNDESGAKELQIIRDFIGVEQDSFVQQ